MASLTKVVHKVSVHYLLIETRKHEKNMSNEERVEHEMSAGGEVNGADCLFSFFKVVSEISARH